MAIELGRFLRSMVTLQASRKLESLEIWYTGGRWQVRWDSTGATRQLVVESEGNAANIAVNTKSVSSFNRDVRQE